MPPVPRVFTRSWSVASVVLSIAAVAFGLLTGARGRGPQSEVKVAPPMVQAMPVDLRVEASAPAAGTKTETRWLRVRGRAERRSGTARAARVEFGLMRAGEHMASKTITVPVGTSFSDELEMPDDGPFTFYAGIVHLTSVVRSADVSLRPREGRDLGAGSRVAIRLRLADDRGRRVDGRVVVYQSGRIVGERYSSGGEALLWDLAPGVYLVRATSEGGQAGSLSDVHVDSDRVNVCVLGMYPPE